MLRVNDDKENPHDNGNHDTDFGPGDKGFHIAVFSGIFCADDCENNGRKHSHDAEYGGKPHVADDDTCQHRGDYRLAGGLLRDFVGSGGHDIALKRTVVS